MDAFKSARLFLPHKVVQIQPDAFALDCLKAFPFLNSDNIMKGLKAELPAYLAHAVGVSSDTNPLLWWKEERKYLPFWSDAIRKVLLIQPSSAAAERVFSILNNSFGSSQDLSMQDYRSFKKFRSKKNSDEKLSSEI